MKLIIAANWKMHKTGAETEAFCREFTREAAAFKKTDAIICPPFTALATAQEALKSSGVFLGAQNLFWEKKGAYTGEISIEMLREFNVTHVIVGHSERRTLMGETDTDVRRKIHAVVDSGLIPILCIGETSLERENNETEKILVSQLRQAVSGLPAEQAENLVIAYEPVWAIGTGQAASPPDAEFAADLIRTTINSFFNAKVAETLRIQYGGSVNADNIGSFVKIPSINGALVGGASLEPDTFSSLIKAAEKAVSN